MSELDQSAWYEPLIPREIEILELISTGLSNREIAQRLHLSPETVKWYNKQIFNKLGVESRTQAVVKARDHRLLIGDLPSSDEPPPPARHNLPAQWTSFVGRQTEIAEIKVLLREQRLVTLTGPGGTGKTRLALQAGRELVDVYRHGVWLVELAPLGDPALLPNAIAQALRLATQGGESLSEILNRSLARRHLLLILDNFEHLLEAAPLATELLSAAPQLSILTTSRERLHLYGEHEYAVNPLPVLDTHLDTVPNSWQGSDAVELFIRRARAARPGFVPDDDQARAIIRICQRLDGLPLALELAASQVKYFAPTVLAERLQNSLASLAGGPRDLPSRQRTLYGAIEWSFDLLDEDAKRMFTRLSIFSGGATLETIERVCGDNLVGRVDKILVSLVDKNLVYHRESPPGETRYSLLETIRQYAQERLASGDEVTLIRQRHADHYVALAEKAQAELSGPQQGYWYRRLRLEQDNLRAVLSQSLAGKDIAAGFRIISALQLYWFYTGAAREGSRWCELAIEKAESAPDHLLAGVYRCAGEMYISLGDAHRSRESHCTALELYRRLGDKRNTALAQIYQSDFALVAPDVRVECIALCLEGITTLHDLNDLAGEARGWNILGEIYRFSNDDRAAEHAYREALSLALKCGDRVRESIQYENLGYLAFHSREYQRAFELSVRAIETLPEQNNEYGLATEMAGLAGPLTAMGAHRLAAMILGASLTSLGNMGIEHQLGDREVIDGYLQRTRQALGDEAFQRLWEAGQGLTLAQAFELALAYRNKGKDIEI
jgi:predicted ATPase/DNA-binding CsgD family transcriptional regulator